MRILKNEDDDKYRIGNLSVNFEKCFRVHADRDKGHEHFYQDGGVMLLQGSCGRQVNHSILPVKVNRAAG